MADIKDNSHDETMKAVEEVMKKYDRESNTRIWEGKPAWILKGILAAFSLFCIYITLFNTGLAEQARLALCVGLSICLGFLIFPARKGVQKVNHIPWYDILIIALTAAAYLYLVINADALLEMRVSKYTWLQLAAAVVMILALAELTRRCVGLPILFVAGAFIVYALFFGPYRPVSLAFRNLMQALVYSSTGILTTPINVCFKFIVVFIIFGAFLERSGVADFFIQMSNAAVGKYSGGPAKVAVIASALEGMASGSSVANTVGSGSITIPMMKKTGYKPEFAGAVEAAASTGGQIMPPIMGAAAFLMSEFVGESYGSIAVRAILPAVLYFAGIFISVHLEAKKMGLNGIPKELLPQFGKLLKKSFLLIPLVMLVVLIASNSMTIQRAAILSILAVLAVGVFNWDNRINFKKIFEALSGGAQSALAVVVACGVAGIISGCITMTGLGSTLQSAVLAASGGNKFLALFMTMLCCIVLGMGVPTTANYCIMASTCAPILVATGIHPIAAHMFVFYFGIVADITPPVALAAYAGSAIAGSNPMKTALVATKLAIAAFIIPYIFCLSPAMLFIDTSVLDVVLIIFTSIGGIFGVAAALEGYLLTHMPWWQRILSAAGGLLLIIPGLVTDSVGFGLVGIVVAMQLIAKKRKEQVCS